MIIAISGTPGTGKTLAAQELARLTGMQLIDVKKMIEGGDRIEKNKYGELEVGRKQLQNEIRKEIKKHRDCIIENHLLCEFELPADFVFVLRTHPKVLLQRLKARKYRKEKINENLLAEMLDYCSSMAATKYKKNIIEIDTTKRTAKETAQKMLWALRNKNKTSDRVDYTDYLKIFLRLK